MGSLSLPRPASLHRYTSLQNVIQMLKTKSLSLREPNLWEDQNDSYALELYKQRCGAKSLLATCFTQASETYHHWKVFASHGACVEFDKKSLVTAFRGAKDLTFGTVKYREIRRLAKEPPNVDDLPFLKRYPYRDEQEFRVVFTSLTELNASKSISFSTAAIRRITLSPWLSEPELQSHKAAIKKISGCANMKVYRTTVLDNKDWKAALRASRV